VELATDSVWLFTQAEIDASAQQRSSGKLHFFFYLDASVRPRKPNRHASDFEGFRLEHRAAIFFGGSKSDTGKM
jgi:hypothetical protein